ncbi:chromosome partition protein Smc [Abditibacteriota bacterium]|nr:chromosome partition protein Smc [Abditibacteriota bacterium]
MQLSRLHLSGFKSFAEETTLEFGSGITAVVGPNGSGKSNIVDALLWCLGERSHKALRGQSATDVIFAGTQTRRATGRAEVNLFFNNESGTLPLANKEVQVTRKLFRDGAGEYGLCGSKCRLRDVLDLFLDTGVGPDAYCIISQGEIDAILSAKPEDRRGLIEGAAGIQKYHARRTETRKRLEKVEADLTRARDIIAELDAQLLPLESQAILARQYDSLAARLKQLQLAVLSRDFQTRVTRLAELRQKQTEGEDKVLRARIDIDDLERVESIGNRRLRELEGEVESLASGLTQLVGDQKSAEGELAVARERKRALTEMHEFAAREAATLRARLETTRADAVRAKSELDEATRESGALSQSAAEAEGRLGEATQKVSEAARELQGLQSRVLEAMRASQAKREGAAADRARAESGRTRLAELEKLLASGQAELVAARTSETDAQTALKTLQAELEAAHLTVESKRTVWQTSQSDAKSALEAVARARENRSSLGSRLRALRELEQNLEGIQGGARGVLEAVRRKELPADYIPVADAIRAQPRFELAIETALGGSVNNLICPDEAAAKRGVEYLKSRRAGRATFLPLSILNASFLNDKTQRLLDEPGVLGLASELVDCKPEHDVAVGYLLNRVIIVETLDDALRLVKRCEGGARLVSLEGEVVLPAGAITGGAGKQKSSGLLARKRELDELDAQLADLEREITQKTELANVANSQIATNQEAWRAAQSVEGEARSRVARAERECEGQSREVRRLKAQSEAIEGQKRALEAKLGASAEDDARYELDAHALEEAARDLEAQVAHAQEIVTQRQNERERVRDDVSGVRATFAQTSERLHAMRRGIGELEKAARELETQIAAKDAQIARAQAEQGGLEGGEVTLINRLEERAARREELERRLQTARTGRGEALEKLEATGISLKTARETLHSGEDELHRVEVRLASTEAELRDIERRLRDEFGRDPEAVLHELEQVPEAIPSPARGGGWREAPGGGQMPESEEVPPSETEPPLPMRNGQFDRRAALEEIELLSGQIGDLGQVNLGAVAQYDSVKERLDFLTEQKDDLEGAQAELDAIIAEIDGRMRDQFLTTFRAIQEAFEQIFVKVMGGGSTRLSLTLPEDLLETGIDLRVQMPGKAAQDIGLLSGGERALTALSFMMAILKVRPSPFVVLDEVDAPLDQSNVGRFTDLLREFTDTTQFIVITHNNGTMQAADVLYGVTQQEAGVSTLMSVRLAEADEMAHV